MYAIIQTGGKQYQVEPGSVIRMEFLHNDPGAQFTTDQVLLLNNDSEIKVGTPVVPGVSVKGTIVKHIKGKKIIVFKMKRRKGYRRTQGHRHQYTDVKIDSIDIN